MSAKKKTVEATEEAPAPAPAPLAAMVDPVTVWDGKFIQFMPAAEAKTKQDAGLVQIFEGPEGYQPGFYMADATEFPLPPLVLPDPTLTAINPTTAVEGVAIPNLVLTGTNFTSGGQAVVGGIAQPTVFVSPTEVRVQNFTPAFAVPTAVLFRLTGHPDTASQTLTVAAAP